MNDKKPGSKVGVGLLGVAVGVAAGAATVVLSDKKNREKALKKAKELHKQAEDTVDTLQKKAQTLLDKVEEVKDEIMAEEGDVVEDTKKELKKDDKSEK